MKTVLDNEFVVVIKNSKFICQIFHLSSIDDVNFYLSLARKKYPDATHYCYAYVFDSQIRKDDDGEPSNTAGMPLLNVLQKNELNRVLCIVIRYFGKIKLGANGLIRAYSNVLKECLEGHIVVLKPAYRVKIVFPYSFIQKIDYLLRDAKILSKNFDDDVIYVAILSEDMFYDFSSFDKNVRIDILEHTYF